jgi:hypothetical protein
MNTSPDPQVSRSNGEVFGRIRDRVKTHNQFACHNLQKMPQRSAPEYFATEPIYVAI